jgi:pimeloyl-ACP methyl ester carboxylesterase
VFVLVLLFQSRLIFPAPSEFSRETPAAAGLPFEKIRLSPTADTFTSAWWIPAEQKTATVIVYFHGNGETMGDEVDREIPLLHATGANVLTVEYRGYGNSSKLRPSGVTTAQDARAAITFLEQRGIATSDVILCGWSIGSAVAAQLAAENPTARGLILLSPISSIMDVAKQMWIFRYPLRPAGWFLGSNRFDTASKISSIHMPLLMFSGSLDTLAAPWMARKIMAMANEPKTLCMVEGADHNDIMDIGQMMITRQITAFIAQTGPVAGTC